MKTDTPRTFELQERVPTANVRPAAGKVSKRRIVWNVGWNWAGMVAQAAVGLVIAPFLIQRLGDSLYGLWILMWSLTEGLGLLDLGVRFSVGRQLAAARGKADARAVSAIVSSSLAILSLVGILMFVGTLIFAAVLPHVVDIPPSALSTARNTMILVGLGFAIHTVLSIFDAGLWALQRFDTLNMIDIPTLVLRALLTFVLIAPGSRLEIVAIVTWGTMILAGLIKAAFCFRFDPDLRPRVSSIDYAAIRELFQYGVWMFVATAGSRIRTALAPVLISSVFSLALVTPFSITVRLIGYAITFMTAAAGVLTPIATAFDAQQMSARIQTLILEGGKFCVSLTLFFSIGLVLLSGPFIGLWIDPRFAEYSALVTILVCGELLAMSQLVSRSVILATARHKVLAYSTLCEGVIGLAVGGLLMRPFGLAGFCVGLSVAAALCRGVVILAFTCRFAKIRLRDYLRIVFLKPAGLALVPALSLWGLISLRPPDTWMRLVLYCAVFTTMFAVFSAPLFGIEQLKFEARRVFYRLRNVPVES